MYIMCNMYNFTAFCPYIRLILPQLFLNHAKDKGNDIQLESGGIRGTFKFRGVFGFRNFKNSALPPVRR